MKDQNRRQRHHIRAARDWLGKAEHSLEEDNEVRGELKVMLAKAELAQARPEAESGILHRWGRRLLPAAAALLIAGGGWWAFVWYRPAFRHHWQHLLRKQPMLLLLIVNQRRLLPRIRLSPRQQACFRKCRKKRLSVRQSLWSIPRRRRRIRRNNQRQVNRRLLRQLRRKRHRFLMMICRN